MCTHENVEIKEAEHIGCQPHDMPHKLAITNYRKQTMVYLTAATFGRQLQIESSRGGQVLPEKTPQSC